MGGLTVFAARPSNAQFTGDMMIHAAILTAVLWSAAPGQLGSEAGPPPVPREFRGVWVATVANIDWPSKPGLSAAKQQEEARAILDRVASLRLNAVVLQVRPAADALYRSALEPWSYYLTGEQGQPPQPGYDPLAFWIEESHRRGLQLHAWFNPFRARLAGSTHAMHPSHVSRAHAGWVKSYGSSLWLDPGEPAARQHTLGVIADVTRRYDVDGIHIDDYFYPYPVKDPATGKELDFPDEPSWNAYRRSGGRLDRADWRRENVNLLIREMYQVIHREKPSALFGISPFGIPRPGIPKGVVGFDQYAKLYADTQLWLRSGWCDYWTPQLYWRVRAPGQPFRPLLEQWGRENVKGRHVWPGLSVSRVGEGPNQYPPEEILEQIAIARETPGASGHVLFSMKALMRSPRGLAERLGEGPYRQPAVVPKTPWLAGGVPPGRPNVSIRDGAIAISPGPGGACFAWAVWTRAADGWTFRVVPAHGRKGPATIETPSSDAAEVVITAVSRLGIESEPLRRPLWAKKP